MDIIEDFLISKKNNPILRNPDKYKLKKVVGITLHYTGVKEPHSFQGVKNYFESSRRYASSHYLVSGKEGIMRLIPDTDVAYHTGRSKTDWALQLQIDHEVSSLNYLMIGIEMLLFEDNVKETLSLTEQLCAQLMLKYGLPKSSIHRHHNISLKNCPMIPRENGEYTLMTDKELEAIRNNSELLMWDIINFII